MAISVTFQEHEDSPKESGNRNGEFNLTRIFLTDWNDRWTFVRELFIDGPFGLPASYSTLWPGVLADSFVIDRIVNAPDSASITDPNTQQLTHSGTLAKITVTYTPLPNDEEESDPGDEQLPEGTWATYNQNQNVEFRTVPGRALEWDSDGTELPPDTFAVVPEMLTTHQVAWHQVRNVPWVTISNMKGKVNATACRLPGSPQIFQPETLMFDGLSDEITLSFDEQLPTRKLTLNFTEKAQSALASGTDGGAGDGTIYGWNHQLRDDTQVYDKPVSVTSGDELFQTYEFNDLWKSTT